MAQSAPIDVFIVERNPLVIAGLKDVIERDGRFVVAGSERSGKGLIEAAQTVPIRVAVVGWKLEDMSCADLLARLRDMKSPLRVVVLSNDHDIGIVKQAVRLGAHGFCFQYDEAEILFDTIRAVARGLLCIPNIDVTKINETPLSKLTVRERELLAALASGWTNLQIATRTGISENTVKYHLKNLYDKLDVRNRAMAVALYAGEGGKRASTA